MCDDEPGTPPASTDPSAANATRVVTPAAKEVATSLDVAAYAPEVQASLRAYGVDHAGARRAHTDSAGWVGAPGGLLVPRARREELLDLTLSPGATRPDGAGNRAHAEDADPYRLCFERDLDRLKYSRPFRRLSGKCQVFLAPVDDMLRNRLTHAQEVAQVALGVSQRVGLCLPLTEAIALAHDCGHGPAGHASEEAFAPFLPDGYDHAVWGADVTLAPLNLTLEVLDGVRNHSWKRPAPSTPEGEVVSWADRVAYVCHDFDDAVREGVLRPSDLPQEVASVAGTRQSTQIRAFIEGMSRAVERTGYVGMEPEEAHALDVFRRFNYERIYLRPASRRQAEKAITLITQLVEYFADAPGRLPDVVKGELEMPVSGSPEAARAAVTYVSGMTDRFALAAGVELLNWRPADLPRGV